MMEVLGCLGFLRAWGLFYGAVGGPGMTQSVWYPISILQMTGNALNSIAVIKEFFGGSDVIVMWFSFYLFTLF